MLFIYDERSEPRENARVSDEAARLLSRAALEWLLAIPQMESLLTGYPLDRVLKSYLTRGEKGYKILNHNVLLHDKMQLISCAPQKPVSFYKTGCLFISILSKKIQHSKAQHVNG